jgi:ligand-binding sensor domain-containing protein/DNA-binding CsgD family transcriptional regulator
MRKIYTLILSFCLFNTLLSETQRIGVPFVRNYKPDMYNAADQNWSIVEDSTSMVYFANESGILTFNGSRWQIVGTAGNLSAFKSVAVDKNGTIYAGAYADIGILKRDPVGRIYYSSLSSKIPSAYKKFDYIWNIIPTDEGVYFQSTYLSFFLHPNGTLEPIVHPSQAQRAFSVSNQIYVAFVDAIRLWANNKFNDIPLGRELAKLNPVFFIPIDKNQILIGTESNGLYIYDSNKLVRFNTSIDKEIMSSKLYCGTQTIDENYALGTLHDGLYIINKSGRMVLHMNTENGLQNNNIINLKTDFIGNLWVTMDKGIDYVELNTAFSKIQTKRLNGFVYSVIRYDNRLYVATHHGLLYCDWDKLIKNEDNLEFNVFPGISEINWSLVNIDGTLFLGHDKGAYIIKGNQAQMISSVKGAWTFIKLKSIPNTVLSGTYTCLISYKKQNNTWKQFKVLKGLNESCRILEEDEDGNIWVTSGYYGVYKIKLSDNADSIISMKMYDSTMGFPKSLFYGIFKIGNELIFGTQYGAYTYNKAKDRMEPHPVFYNLLKNNHVRKIVEGPNNTYWYIVNSSTGIFKQMSDGSFNHITIPLQKISDDYVPGFENLHFIDEKNVILGTKHGLLIYNPIENRNYFRSFVSIIDQVLLPSLSSDSLLVANITTMINSHNKPVKLKYKYNNIHFKFSALYYENPSDIKYKYMLEGFDIDWSNWSNKTEKEYTNLPEGTYTFRVKAKNIYDYESREAVFHFTVLPPWYRSKLAYLCYFLIIALFFYLFVRQKNKKFELEKQKIEEENQRAMQLKIAEHEKEKLEEELRNKQKDLAMATMNIAEKNEKLMEIKDQLLEIHDLPDKERRKVDILIRMLENEINDDSYWEQFEQHFNLLNDDFLNKLKNNYPDITHKDLKMCAFLRMNLSNKEIASLLNITLRGVEASRLRLRKKLNLPKDMPLNEFILRY